LFSLAKSEEKEKRAILKIGIRKSGAYERVSRPPSGRSRLTKEKMRKILRLARVERGGRA